MSIFANANCNTGRQLELDVAKALAIAFMVIIHVYEQIAGLSGTPIEDMTTFDTVLQFLAGPATAPLFLVAMGVGLAYSKNQEPWALFRRGVALFLLAYLLNGARDAFPYYYATESADNTFYYMLLNVEVLHLAGLSLMLLSILRGLGLNVWLIGLLALGLQHWGNSLSDTYGFATGIGRCLWGLFFFTGAESCFPLLTWFVYPAAGLIFGTYLQRVENKDSFYLWLTTLSGLALLAFCWQMRELEQEQELVEFFALADYLYYQQDLLSFIFSLLVVLLELGLLHGLLKAVTFAPLLAVAGFMSVNITKIYCLQWVLIERTREAVEVGRGEIIPYGLGYLLASMALAWIIAALQRAMRSEA